MTQVRCGMPWPALACSASLAGGPYLHRASNSCLSTFAGPSRAVKVPLVPLRQAVTARCSNELIMPFQGSFDHCASGPVITGERKPKSCQAG